MANELVTVETFRFLPEAEAAKLHLEAEGCSAFLADAETVNMDWFLGNAIGYIKLQVPSGQAEMALALLRQLREKRQERRQRGDDPESPACLACGEPMAEEASTCPSCGWSYASGEDG